VAALHLHTDTVMNRMPTGVYAQLQTVFAVTDGEPSDKPPDKIFSVIRECVEQCTRLGYGPHAVAFQFAQVGCPKDCWEGAHKVNASAD
jgi:hypothetical protein